MAPKKSAGFKRRDASGQARVKGDGVALRHDDMEPLAEQWFEAAVECGADNQGGEQGVFAGDENAVDDPSFAAANLHVRGGQPGLALFLGKIPGPAHGSAGCGVFEKAEFTGAGDGKDGGVRPRDVLVQLGTFEGWHENHAPTGVGGVVSEGRSGDNEEDEKSALAAVAWSGSGHGQ